MKKSKKPKKPKLKNLRLSVSSVEAFESCQAKWYYRYIEKLPSPPNYYTTAGSFIHKILEIYFRRYKKNGGNLRDAAGVAYRLACKDKDLAPDLTPEIKSEAKEWTKQITKIYEESPDSIPNALKVETSFVFKFEEENITVRGFIDRIDQVDDNTIRIVDYKTSSNPSYLKSFQLATYAFAMKKKYPDKDIHTAYELIRHNFKSMPFTIKDKDYQNVGVRFKTAAKQIRELKETSPDTPWKPTVTNLCTYCPYKMRCEKDRSSSSWQV